MTISRRRLLKAAPLALPYLAPNVAYSLRPGSRKPPSLRPGSGIKLKGAIISMVSWPYWTPFWFNFQWADQIKPSIDAAAALGMNCIKWNCVGINDAGYTAQPSDSVMQAEIAQIIEYAAQKGLVTYAQLGYQPQQSFGSDLSGLAAGTAAAAKIAGWLDKFPSVVGIDVMNEWYAGVTGAPWLTHGGVNQAVADLTTYITAIRATTSKPLTMSANADQYIYTLIDYHDIHQYNYTGINSAGLTFGFDTHVADSLRGQSWYKGAFIIGETGMPGGTTPTQGATPATSNYTDQDRQNWFATVPLLTNAPDCMGACIWCEVDSYPIVPGAWGLFPQPIRDNWNNPRPGIAAALAIWPNKL